MDESETLHGAGMAGIIAGASVFTFGLLILFMLLCCCCLVTKRDREEVKALQEKLQSGAELLKLRTYEVISLNGISLCTSEVNNRIVRQVNWGEDQRVGNVRWSTTLDGCKLAKQTLIRFITKMIG